MGDVCNQCGLPQELCVCETIAKETQDIIVKTIKKKFNKVYTDIRGIDSKEISLKDLAKKLKNKFACGGTAKDGKIELQGDHKQKVKEFLTEMGFPKETIKIKT